MSGQSDIDHPLCEECTDTLLDQLDHQLKVTTDELNDYSKEFLDKMDSSKNEDTESLSKELEDLKLEESQLILVLMERYLEYFLAIILSYPLTLSPHLYFSSFRSPCTLVSPFSRVHSSPLTFILLLPVRLPPLSRFTLHPCPSLLHSPFSLTRIYYSLIFFSLTLALTFPSYTHAHLDLPCPSLPCIPPFPPSPLSPFPPSPLTLMISLGHLYFAPPFPLTQFYSFSSLVPVHPHSSTF